MQEKYLSLDPARAESMNRQSRTALFQQRVYESMGGDAMAATANPFSLGAMCLVLGMFKSGGFTVWPITVRKAPRYGGILLACLVGGLVSSSLSMCVLGDLDNFIYLKANKSAILKGELPFDRNPTT